MRLTLYVLFALALSASSAAAGEWKTYDDVSDLTDYREIGAGTRASKGAGGLLISCMVPPDGSDPYYVVKAEIGHGIYSYNGRGEVNVRWRYDKFGIVQDSWRTMDGTTMIATTDIDAMHVATSAYESKSRIVIEAEGAGYAVFKTGTAGRKALAKALKACGDSDLLDQ